MIDFKDFFIFFDSGENYQGNIKHIWRFKRYQLVPANSFDLDRLICYIQEDIRTSLANGLPATCKQTLERQVNLFMDAHLQEMIEAHIQGFI